MSFSTTTPPSRRTQVQGLRGFTVAVGVVAALLLAGAGVMVHDYNTSTGDDPLIGLAIVLAIALAAPAGAGLVLVGLAWAVRRRFPRTAAGLVQAALAVVLLPVAVVVWMWIPVPL